MTSRGARTDEPSDMSVVRATHRVANLVRNMRASPQTLLKVGELLSQIEALLEPDAWPGPFAVEQLSPPGQKQLVYEPANLALTVPFSPLLGERNPMSPELDIHAEQGCVKGRIRFGSLHAGPMNTVHGSVVAGLFDEILALANLAKGHMGFTRSLSVQFLRPTPLGSWLDFSAECAGTSGRNLMGSAEIRADGEVTASATGLFKLAAQRDADPYASMR